VWKNLPVFIFTLCNSESIICRKLTLSCVQWTFLQDGDDEVLEKFVNTIRGALDKIDQETVTTDYETEVVSSDVATDACKLR